MCSKEVFCHFIILVIAELDVHAPLIIFWSVFFAANGISSILFQNNVSTASNIFFICLFIDDCPISIPIHSNGLYVALNTEQIQATKNN